MLRQMAAEDAPDAATAELKAKAERHENEVRVDHIVVCSRKLLSNSDMETPWSNLFLTS